MKIKKFLMITVFAVLFTALSVLLSSCDKATTSSGYVSDEEREAHILELLDGSLDNVMDPSDYEAVRGGSGKNDVNKKLGIVGMRNVIENDNYILYFDFDDTSIAVYDKETGMVYHSDPTNAVKADGNELSTTADDKRGKLHAPLTIEAYDSLNKRFEFNFYENCYLDKNFYIKKMDDDTIRIVYTIGNDPDKELVPPVLTVSTYNWIMEQIEKIPDAGAAKTYKKAIQTSYNLNEPDSLSLEVKEQYLAYYPTLDYEALYIGRSLTSKQKNNVKNALTAIGFTVEMLKQEMEKVDYSGPERAVMYTIPVDISLDDNGLTLNVDTSLILAPEKQKLYKIYFYRAFGGVEASDTSDDTKYMILPDGSGSVMPLFGGMTTDAYSARLYGSDQTFNPGILSGQSAPVLSSFGIYDRGDYSDEGTYGKLGGSMMMVLEDGAAQAFISARPYNEVSNPIASLNFDLVYSERDYRTYSGGQSIGGASSDSSGSGVVLAKDETIANFVVRYMFGEGGKTYSEYAEEYRNYLIEAGKLPAETISDGATQLYIDFIGSFEKTESVVGVPTVKKKALTTYSDILEVLEKLNADGAENVNARYLYWSNGGFYNTAYNEVELLDLLGTKKELSSLVEYCTENGYGFFPNVDMQYVYRDTVSDGFNYSQDSARRLDMRLATINHRSPASGSLAESNDFKKTIISPDILPEMAATFEASYEEIIGNGQISLAAMGEYLNSNYKTNRNVNRTKSYEYQLQALEVFKDYELMVDNGNDYTWNIADHILNMPMGSSEYLSAKESIPFIQMVLHGYVYYAPEAFNINANYDDLILYCIETGSNVYFRWMGEEDTILYNTAFTNWYSLNYNNSYDTALEVYNAVKVVLDKVASLPITQHEGYSPVDRKVYIAGGEVTYLQPGDPGYREGRKIVKEDTRVWVDSVYKTVYGDQYTVYVNYNSFDIQFAAADGTIITVPAKDYVIFE